MAGPTAFQIEVANIFFSLPASDGFVLALMMRSIVRFTDAELPIDESLIDDLRFFFEEWANELDPMPPAHT